MSRTIVADVVVVGLGAMGAATLYQLARRGIDAVGIDRFVSPHDQGSSHGETRITRCGVGEGQDYIPLVLDSHRIWREIEAETGAHLLEACGCLIMAPSSSAASHHGKTDFVGRSIAGADAYGLAHEVLTGEEVARRFPQIRAADDAHAYYEPGGGFVYPERCIAAQLDLARRRGARGLTRTVVGLAEAGGRVRIETEEGSVEAARAVVAAGAWTGPLLGAPFAPLLRVTRQVLHWFPVEGAAYAPGRHPALIWMHGAGDEAYFYGFPALPGSNLIKLASERYALPTTPEAVDRTVGPDEAEAFHAAHVAGRLTGVGAEAVASKVCLYTSTPDAGFLIDAHPAMPNVTVVSACSGHGFKHSAGIGAHVAGLVAGEEGRREAFALTRFAGTSALA